MLLGTNTLYQVNTNQYYSGIGIIRAKIIARKLFFDANPFFLGHDTEEKTFFRIFSSLSLSVGPHRLAFLYHFYC